ncbi:hypothetical protein [Pseudomonas sp. MF6787]|uniref:hypothetical protein n=1 Tax=Pseudomonas sp. MF6787 TaxID=2797536 RepID=UPI002FCD7394
MGTDTLLRQGAQGRGEGRGGVMHHQLAHGFAIALIKILGGVSGVDDQHRRCPFQYRLSHSAGKPANTKINAILKHRA